jgi:acetyl esterase
MTQLHPRVRAAIESQRREPLTMENISAVRQSMRDAVPEEVGVGPRLDEATDVDAGGVPARWYRNAAPAGTIVYAHGGGWVMGDLETHDAMCRSLVAASGWAVLAVDYRRAPESPYPAALDDVHTALDWARARDSGPVAVGGDSAGGQLAAALARRARDTGAPVAAQVLICPVLSPAVAYPALDLYGLRGEEMRFFWDAYAPPDCDRGVPDLDPLHADPAGLPPAVIVTAELDILRDEAEEYARRLTAAGVPVVCARYNGVNHNFVRKLALFDAGHAALAQIGAALNRLASQLG